jgi:hypothetical protein
MSVSRGKETLFVPTISPLSLDLESIPCNNYSVQLDQFGGV